MQRADLPLHKPLDVPDSCLQFELRYEEVARARLVFEKYTQILPSVKVGWGEACTPVQACTCIAAVGVSALSPILAVKSDGDSLPYKIAA